jgi:hypothetical protein
MAAAITAQSLIADTGRENGPDFVLTPLFNPIAGGAITANSNITEVLNVIAYLCNPVARINGVGPNPRTDEVIVPDQSVQGTVGLHNPNGQYVADDGAGASANSIWCDDTVGAGTPSTQMINLDTFLVPAPYTANHIPQGILAREPVQGGAVRGDAHLPIAIAAAAAAGPLPDDIRTELSCAVKQMITILIKTRVIFGPKGWTELFSRVKGGGSSRSKNAKRTHRHRRRYSSKQY